MKLKKQAKVFSLIDTNGRRNDILNAYKSYAKILDDFRISPSNPWQSFPKSLVQFNFYKRAVEDSPDTFKNHERLDDFEKFIETNSTAKQQFFTLNAKFKDTSESQYNNLDQNIEQRARHYTSSLVSLGFATPKRMLTQSGRALLDPSLIEKDLLEQTLGLPADNALMLRQLLKIRIYSPDSTHYYSPGKLALYLVLNDDHFDKALYEDRNFFSIIQLTNPNLGYTSDELVKCLEQNGYSGLLNILLRANIQRLPDEIDQSDGQFSKSLFYQLFTNRKSKKMIDVYYRFYKNLFAFNHDRSQATLDCLIETYNSNKPELNKAFGYGKALFNVKSQSTKLEDFVISNDNNPLLSFEIDSFNLTFYNCFVESKLYDIAREYASPTRYVLKSTGLFQITAGIVSLKNKALLNNQTILENLKTDIFGTASYDDYEVKDDCAFGQLNSLMEILNIQDRDIEEQIQQVAESYNLINTGKTLEQYLEEQRSTEFEKFIQNEFPRNKVFEILELFCDRKNDKKIQKEVTSGADIPTIFEFISGIAWFYLSKEEHYDLLNSFNLTFDSSYLPLTHAGGGKGDIVIDYRHLVLQLEVTLMNPQAQKRGEWEPVLRHSVNLAIESPKPCITLFLANNLDQNTINIWRAVATVPLESSNRPGEFTRSIKIMPLQISDFIDFSSNSQFSSQKFFKAIDSSYAPLTEESFDITWRKKILDTACE